MTPRARARAVLFLAVLVSIGLGVFVILRERDERAASRDDALLGDASADGDATAATGKRASKTKTKTNAKSKARAGKTRITRRPPPAPAPAPAPAPVPNREGHAKGDPLADDDGESAPTSTPAPRRPHRHYAVTGQSYESALAANHQQVTIGAHAGPDLSDAQLSGPMSDGSFIGDCDAPDDMEVTVKVAIRMGRAVGVTVRTQPPSADVAGCIDHHVRALTWPSSPKMDSFVTTY